MEIPPIAALIFYRAFLQGGATAPIDALVAALAAEGIAALPIFVASLKERACEAFLAEAFAALPPAIVLNTTAFAVSKIGAVHAGTVLDRPGKPVLQVDPRRLDRGGLARLARADCCPRDLTMGVVLPEVDGRLSTRAISFKAETLDPLTHSRTTSYVPVADRVAFVARQAAAWVQPGAKPAKDRRDRDHPLQLPQPRRPHRQRRRPRHPRKRHPPRPAPCAKPATTLPAFPETGAEADGAPPRRPGQPQRCRSGRSEAESRNPSEVNHSLGVPGLAYARPERQAVDLPLAAYESFLATIPPANRAALTERWGAPEDDPFFADGAFRLAVHRFGNVVVAIQPGRGYAIDPKATYHDPALVPPHHYLAFYAWLREAFAADAMVQLGKHGNLEWLPGKALGLSEACWPEIALGALPLVYPFIVNDPGEGAQAKRRASAVIVDHLMPAMTRAEVHGGLAELETLIDEYYLAAGIDPRRRAHLEKEILAAAERHALDRDLGFTRANSEGALRALDAYLCELKEMQIRDGLHTLGSSPEGGQRIDTLVAIARVPRSGGRPADQSLQRAIAADLGLENFDPLDCDPAAAWTGPRHPARHDPRHALAHPRSTQWSASRRWRRTWWRAR